MNSMIEEFVFFGQGTAGFHPQNHSPDPGVMQSFKKTIW
jgi:hypothetical protein